MKSGQDADKPGRDEVGEGLNAHGIAGTTQPRLMRFIAPASVFKVAYDAKASGRIEDDLWRLSTQQGRREVYHLQVAQNKRILALIVKNLLKERFEEKQNQFRDQGIPVEPISAPRCSYGQHTKHNQRKLRKLELVAALSRVRYILQQPEVSMGYSKSNQSLLQSAPRQTRSSSKEVKPDGLARCWAVVIGGSRDPGTMNRFYRTALSLISIMTWAEPMSSP